MSWPTSTIWTYPWDLIDEGPEQAVQKIRDTGLEAVSLASAYHSFEMLRPHLPGDVLLRSPRSAVYFQPNPALPLNALVSPWMGGDDWWRRCADAIQAADLGLIAWTVFLHNTEVALNHPECAQVHATGDVSTSQLCPANARVRDYAVAIATNLARYGISVLECESLSYGPAGHRHYHPKVGVELGTGGQFLHSLCFCAACCEAAGIEGIDPDTLRKSVDQQVRSILATGTPLDDEPNELIGELEGLDRFLKVREHAVSSLVAEVKAASGTSLSYLGMGDPYYTAASFESLRDVGDGFEILVYTSDVEQIRGRVGEAAEGAGDASRLTVGLQAYPPAAREAAELLSQAEAVRACGVKRLSFYNYGILPLPNLRWIENVLSP